MPKLASSRARVTGLSIAALVSFLSTSCSEESPTEPVSQSTTVLSQRFLDKPPEAEFIGVLYSSEGVRETSTDYWIMMRPYDALTRGRIHGHQDSIQWLNPDEADAGPWMYGFYMPPAGGPCSIAGTLLVYQTGNPADRGDEVHRPGPGLEPSGPEGHCIVPGRWEITFTLGQEQIVKQLVIDYLQPRHQAGAPGFDLMVSNQETGQLERIESLEYLLTSGVYVDLILHHDLTPGSFVETDDLYVENAQGQPYGTVFDDEANPTGANTDHFRFSVSEDGSTWGEGEGAEAWGSALARLFWDMTDIGFATGFYTLDDGNGSLIRIHRFTEFTSPRTVQVGLELMRPDEQPGAGVEQVTTTRNVTVATIDPLPPTASFSPTATATWLYADQLLDASNSESPTGSQLEYRWQFEQGGSWTSWLGDPVLEFAGHYSSGSKDVTLEVRDTGSGLVDDTTIVFGVTSSVVTLSGPTYVTDKTLKTYSSNHAGSWFERLNPDTNMDWGTARLTGASTYNRIWPAGWYDVALRNHVDSTPLKRRRLNIEVCWKCSPEIETHVVSAGGLNASMIQRTGEEDWGVFGAGPWISAGSQSSPELVRFYDLTGLHEPGSPFADAGWMGETGGVTTDAAGRWQVDWSQLDALDPNIKGFEFAVTPLSGAVYEFGMAIDPDLNNPTDDESGFDNGRGMIYVVDGSDALGFLLLDSNGNSALLKVNQYGAKKFAPGAKDEAWKAQREPNVKLRDGTDDVQLILSTAESSGVQSWSLWMLRGDGVQDIRKLADQVLGEL